MKINNKLILIIHFYATLFMTGLIWLIQIVHYPSYNFIDLNRFIEFQKFHQNSITLIVMPLMTLELLSAIFLASTKQKLFVLNLIGVIAIWITTFFYSVKYHQLLEISFNQEALSLLISTNWIRTFLWTTRSFILFYAFYKIIYDRTK
jgi:hypothetical protein